MQRPNGNSDKDSGEIYVFSHDPIRKAKSFKDFNQYLLFEILETEKLIGEGIDEEQEQALQTKYLSDENIDYDFRAMKM